MKNARIKLGILGLGLIGSSLLKALYKNEKYEIYCHSNSSFKNALKYCKNSSNDINILKNCDIIFVCSKFSKTLEELEGLNNILNKKTIVCDVASIKAELLNNLSNKKYNFNFILSHPMAGSEKTGFKAGDKNLFKGSKWLIQKNNKLLIQVIEDVEAIPLKIDMNNHDYMCAQISHLPALLSFLLFDCADDYSKQIASSGFRDTTRLAMTNSDLIMGMLKNNGENIFSAFELLKKRLNYLKNLSDSEKIKLFNTIAQKRAKMYDKNGKNIFKI